MRGDGGKLARFEGYHNPNTAKSLRLPADHPAVTEGRTMFPSRVSPVAAGKRLLKDGFNNSKVGKFVTKGPWSGFAIFTLTLEERATCPRSCAQWLTCYGSAMQWPQRWDYRDPDFMDTLRAEIITLARLHPDGLVIRLHILGDFFSLDYVRMWAEMLDRFPQLHVYGYTARREDADDEDSRAIAKALRLMSEHAWDAFAVRLSHAKPGPGRAIVVDAPLDSPDVIMCPAQTDDTETCGTCGLCWHPAAKDKTIAFLRHGAVRTGRKPKTKKEPRVNKPKPEKHYTSRSSVFANSALPAAQPTFQAPKYARSTPAPRAAYDACKWPIGDPGEIGFTTCGQSPLAGRPYCAAHANIAYRAPADSARKLAQRLRKHYA